MLVYIIIIIIIAVIIIIIIIIIFKFALLKSLQFFRSPDKHLRIFSAYLCLVDCMNVGIALQIPVLFLGMQVTCGSHAGFQIFTMKGNGMGHCTEFCYQKRLIRTCLWLNLLSIKKTKSQFFKCFFFCDFNLHGYCGLTKVWVSKRFEHIAAFPYIYDWTIKFRVRIVAGNDLQQLLIRLWHVSTIVPGCCERSLEGIATCHIPGKRAGSLHDYRPPRPTFLHVSAYLQKYTVDNLHVHRVYMQTPAHIHAYLHTCIHDYMHIYIYINQYVCLLAATLNITG